MVFQDKDFGKQTLHKGHANPLAEVTTSLKTYQHFTLEKAYAGEDFFWAFTPVAGDFIRIRFFTPVRIERSGPAGELDGGSGVIRELRVCFFVFRFFFRSGNIEHPGDKLFNTSVEVLPFDVSPAPCGPKGAEPLQTMKSVCLRSNIKPHEWSRERETSADRLDV